MKPSLLFFGAAFLASAAAADAADPKPVFSSPVVTSKTPGHSVEISVELGEAKKVFLVVTDGGNGYSCDWADWVAPRFTGPGKEVRLTSLKPKSASTGWGKISVGKNAGGGELVVNGEKVEDGIGVHANSVLEYDVPEGVTRFVAKGGLDHGGVSQQGGAETSVKFEVYTEKPKIRSGGSQGTFDPENTEPETVPVEDFVLSDPNLEVTIWAQSPMFFNPTNMDVDKDGRIWVAEGVNYRGHANRRPEGDRIVVLEDTDNDGRADSSHVFVQESFLVAPLGVAVIGNKVVVSQPPSMIVYTDVDGDLRFDPEKDKREELLTGFNGRNHDHSLHSVTVGPDGLWYWNSGNMGAKFTDNSGKKFNCGSPYALQDIAGQPSDDGHVYIGGFTARMQPDGTHVEIIGHNYRNSYEQAVTSFGHVFQNDNDDPPACRTSFVLEYGNAGFASADGKRSWGADRRPGQDTPTAEWRQEDPGVMPAGDIYGGGSPTGIAYYENGVLGEGHRGTLLSCEAARNVVFGYRPVPDGAGFRLERFDFMTSNAPDDEGKRTFVGADFAGGSRTAHREGKLLFRPSDVMVGADGAIYVSDWYDPRVGGHQDLDGTCSGTIYRIAPKGANPSVAKSDLGSIEGKVSVLKNPAANVRALGFYGLRDEGEKAVGAVSKLLEDEDPYLQARAVYLLAQLGDAGKAAAEGCLESDSSEIRVAAYRALRRASEDADVVKLAEKMAGDPSAAVRREVATSLRDVPFAKSGKVLLQLAEQFDGEDRTYLDAWGIGCSGKEGEVFSAIATAQPDSTKWSRATGRLVWRLMTEKAVPSLKARALAASVPPFDKKVAMDALAFIKAKAAGEAMVEIASAKGNPLQEGALWWVKHRDKNDWNGMGLLEELNRRGIKGAEPVELVAAVTPDPAGMVSKLPPAEEILKLKGDPAKGKVVSSRCVMCHTVGGVGIDYGPGLDGWGRQFPPEVVLKALVEPSAEIAHGYEGTVLTTKSGVEIHGRVLATSDPVIIRSMGGIEQAVPKRDIASQKPLGRSLMLSADQLGLTAQELADLVAYLRQ